jgi:hypothetical protein
MQDHHNITTEQKLYLFDLRGFVVISEVLGAHELRELNQLIDIHLKRPPGPDLKSQVFENFLCWGRPFLDLLMHERIIPFIRQICDDRVRLDRYYGLHMVPGTTGVPLHGGAMDLEDQSEYYLFSGGRIRNGIMTVSWALTDALFEHGGFACIPGSHKSCLPRPDLLPEECLVHVPVRAGDVIIFTGALAHRGTHWAGPHHRRSLLFKYAPRHIAWSRSCFSWPRELLDLLTTDQRQLFHPPGGLESDDIGVG